jgi:hypothetical protein
MPQGTSHKTKNVINKKYRNEFVHHIATFNSPKDVVLVGDLSHYAANMIFNNRAPLSKQSLLTNKA